MFSAKQIKAFARLCDGYFKVPEEEAKDSFDNLLPSQHGVPEKILKLIPILNLSDQHKLKTLIKLIASPFVGFTCMGPVKSLDKYSDRELQYLLEKWSRSSISDLRIAHGLIKKLSAFYFFAQPDSPLWSPIGYSGALAPPMAQIHPLQTIQTSAKKLSCDVLIIGSGCGGSLVAAQLAEAGYDVIIVEKGTYLRSEKNNQNEEEMLAEQYEMKGLMANSKGDLSILAGANLGGGSSVNWAGCFRTPDYILREWAEAGNPHFTSSQYREGFEYIEQTLSVTVELSRHNPQNQALNDGAKLMGCSPSIIARNVRKEKGVSEDIFWRAQGYSPHGDAFHTKKTAGTTLLHHAQKAGARIYTEAQALKIIHKANVASGALIQQKDHSLAIHAKRVVISGGSIHTPVLLKKSGIRHPEIGKNLYLHPTSFTIGIYDHPIKTWEGPMMSCLVNDFAKLSDNYGYKLETAPFHPGILAVATPWKSSKVFKNRMRCAQNMAVFITLVRDKYGGSVDVDKTGKPIVNYSLHPFDKKHLLHGIQKGLEIHKAVDAKEYFHAHNQTPSYTQASQDLNVSNLSWRKGSFGLGSAHQMGTCRMGGDRKKYPVQPSGELWSTKNLWVADASLFPSASGVNPMISVYGLAYHVAQELKASL